MTRKTVNPKQLTLDVHEALDLVEVSIPVKWYEREVIPTTVGFIGGLLVVLLQIHLNLLFDWRLGLVSVFVVLIGEAFDIYSTIEVLRLRPLFLQKHLEFPVLEANRLLPKYPTNHDLIVSKPTVIAVLVALASFFLPSSGLQVGVSKLCVVLSNYRKKRRVEKVLEWGSGEATLRVADYLPDVATDKYVRVVIG